MTPAQAAARMTRIANGLQRRCTRALVLSSKQGADIGRDLSAGGYSQAELTEMGHPYAVRHAQVAARHGMTRKQYVIATWGVSSIAADYIVNKQTGEFAAAWGVQPPNSAFSGALRTAVINNSPVAGFLAGKNRPRSTMVRRPIDDKVAELLRPIAVENVREAVKGALRTK